jgi:hypothetical protein
VLPMMSLSWFAAVASVSSFSLMYCQSPSPL